MVLVPTQPKKIYIGSNEVKKVYLGSTQVRPSVFEYSYDFRNKTTTQLANDGWTNTSGLTTGANGVTSSSWRAIDNTINGLGDAMANAKKLRIEMLTYNSQNTGGTTAGVLLLKDTDGYTQTGFYVNIYAYEALCGYVSVVTGSISNYTGEVTIIGEFDFVNKTFYFKLPNIYENTVSITDSGIAIARTTNGIRCPLERTRYLESFSIKVEY